MKKYLIGSALMFAAFGTASASAAENLTASFTTAAGAATVQKYSGLVRLTVTGIGQSFTTDLNDAFYLYDTTSAPPVVPVATPNNGDYFQLTFSTTALTGNAPAQDAKNYLVGALPAYNPNHSYTFILNTGLTTPGTLHFGVGDGNYADNSGAYNIAIAAVPEPMTWAMMVLGFGLVGVAVRRRQTQNQTLALA